MRWRAGGWRAVRRLQALGLRGWLNVERDTLLQMAKTALAASLAWAAASALLDSSQAALAALAAVIVVQVTVYQSLAQALQFVAGVVLGLLVAVALAQALGVNAISVGLVMFGALLVGRAVRLGRQSTQVAISALLVLNLGTTFGTRRILDTILGAAVGVLVNLLVLPPTHVASAGRTLRGVAEDLADLCNDIGRAPAGSWGYDEAREWLGRAREVDAELREADDALEQGEESVRYNPRRRSEAETLARYREAWRALDHGVIQVRGLVRTLTDLAEADVHERAEATPVLAALGDLLRSVRDAVRAFGALQTDEPHQWEAERHVLRVALERAVAARDNATRALHSLPPGRVQRMLASALVDAERLLTELDPDGGQHTGALPRAD